MLDVSTVIPILITANKSGAGKDFTANYITNYFEIVPVQDRVKVEAVKVSIVAGMKEIAADLFGYLGVKRATFYEVFRKSRNQVLSGTDGKTVVDLWVALGSFARDLHEDVWINAFVKRLHVEGQKYDSKEFPKFEEPFSRVLLVCAPDWRFNHELQYVRQRYPNVLTIHITSEIDVKEQGLDDKVTVTDFDWQIHNDKTDQFKIQLMRMCQEIRERVQVLAPSVEV